MPPSATPSPTKRIARPFSALLGMRWAAVAVHLAISVPLAVILNIRLDEGYTLQTTGNGVRYAWQQAIQFELQPPLFFVLLSVWRKLDHSILFARVFSVICVALAVALSYGLAKRYLPQISPQLVTFLIALNPFTIWTALDIRVYGFALLLTAGLLLLFFDGFLDDEGPGWARWAYLLLAAASLYTQYYLGFFLFAGAVALVFQRRWRALRFYLLGMFGVGLVFLPMLREVFQQFTVHAKDIAQKDDFRTTLADFLWIIKGHILPAESTKFELIRWWLQVIGMPILALFFVMHWRRINWARSGPLWTIFAVMVPFYFYLRYQIGYGNFSPRHTVGLFLLAVLSFLAAVWVAGGRKAAIGWSALVLLASVVSLYAVYRPLAKPGDWRRTAEYVTAHEKPDQPILFFTPTGALPFSYYYHGPNRLIPLPRPETFDTYDVERYIIHSEDELKAVVPAASNDQRMWLVTDHFCRLQDVEFNCPLLEDFVVRYYVTESDQELYGSRIRLLRPRVASDPPVTAPK